MTKINPTETDRLRRQTMSAQEAEVAAQEMDELRCLVSHLRTALKWSDDNLRRLSSGTPVMDLDENLIANSLTLSREVEIE